MAVARVESTRERLIAAAIEVFVDQGYEQARVQDIARTAGLTTGAIYANYRGKADLLSDAINARTAAEVDALLHDQTHGSRELLEALGDSLLRRRDEAPALLLDAIAAARRDDDLAATLRDRLGSREHALADLTDAAKRNGTIDDDIDTATFARFCTMLAMGALVMRTLDTDPPDRDEWHTLLGRLLDAVSPKEK